MNKKHFKIPAMIIAGIFCVYNAQGQTYGSGVMTNTCGTPSGTTPTSTGTFIGCGAGATNAAGGTDNTFFGYRAGNANSTGDFNTFVGMDCGLLNTASINTFMGWKSGDANTSGTENVFMGGNSGSSNTTGSTNVFIGNSAGASNTTTGANVFVGNGSGSANTAGSNVFFGSNSGNANTSGTPNVFVGTDAGLANTTASHNVGVGYRALYTQSYSSGVWNSYNVAVGNEALYFNQPTSTSNGARNTALGYESMYTNTTGYQNTGLGFLALFSNTTGYYNTATGNNSLQTNSTGYYNTANGISALYSNTTGHHNAAGGKEALYYNTTGSFNTSFGESTGWTITTGSNNTCVGSGADVNNNAWANTTAVGNSAVAQVNGDVQLGNANINGVYCWPNVFAGTSDGRFKFNVKEDVKGLDFILKLRPVTFQYDTKKGQEFIVKDKPDSIKTRYLDGVDFTVSTSKVHSGFIAQEVQKAASEVGFNSSIVGVPADTGKATYTMSYGEIVVPLVKAIQELSKTVDSLKAAANGGSQQRRINSGDGGEKNVEDIKLELPEGATLSEPQPNPNSGSTQISYYLPESNSGAKIIFTDMLGKVMLEKTLQPGYGMLNIDTQDLPGGVYSYSLVVDGKVIDNKKMMRNK